MKIKCEICGKEYSKYGIKNHIAVTHEGKTERVAHRGMLGKKGWSKGLTKENEPRLQHLAKQVSIAQTGKSGHAMTEGIKEKISKAMKKAHVEKRAWNIGKSRWNNEPSYPEKFFMKVIENEIDDKNYQREYPVGIYSIDFAWVERKLAIEIDGEQHERFEEYKARDKKKDEFLKTEGWQVLRIKWKEVFHNPQNEIQKLKNFINA